MIVYAANLTRILEHLSQVVTNLGLFAFGEYDESPFS